MILCATEKCTSCKACLCACPKNCISFIENELGYVYPQIDSDSCVDCGNCAKVCHVLNEVESNDSINAYAAWSLDANDRKSSTSGGVASVFYQSILSQDGVCYGAIIDEKLNVIIDGYSDENIIKFKKSKYVHSDMGSTYTRIKRDLLNGKKVIFIGLPCQIASVKSFLKKDYDNLILVDLICHGTPPQKHFLEHIAHIEEKCEKNTSNISFRKDNSFMFLCYAQGEDKPFYKKNKNADAYMLPFFESLNYYDSCYTCKYAQNKRVSDITIGDFWGLGLKEPFNHPYSGAISLVLINTEKGKNFFESTKHSLFYEERPTWEALSGNDQLNNPSKASVNRERFLSLYKEVGFDSAVENIYREFMKKEERAYIKNQRYIKLRRLVKKLIRR